MSEFKVYVGKLSSRTRERDLEDEFSKFGKIVRCDLKMGYAFLEFSDPRDAEDAVKEMDGQTIDGSRIIVERAKGERRERGGDRGDRGGDRGDRGGDRGRGPRTDGTCFVCGKTGHWARDCTVEDARDRCFNCGRTGHLARECKERRNGRVAVRSHPYSRGGRSRSRSRSPRRYSRSPRRYSRSPRGGRSRSRSYSPRRSPAPARGRSPSPVRRAPSPGRRSPSPNGAPRSPPRD